MKLPDELGISLVCPECRHSLRRVDDSYVCAGADCRRSYPIDDEIPRLLVDDARILSPEDWQRFHPSQPPLNGSQE